jgi:fluoride exporter
MISVVTWLAVVVGAAVGAPARYLVDRAVTARAASAAGVGLFPWGLSVVNVTGSALAGVVVATTTGDLRVLLLAGFCGAFTTFSGFAWETERLWSGARGVFWLAMTCVPLGCVAAFLATWHLAGLAGG